MTTALNIKAETKVMNRQTVIFMVAYLLAFGVAAWAGYYSYADYTLQMTHGKSTIGQDRFQTDIAYVDLPQIAILLPSAAPHAGRVRMDITLEVDNKYAPQIEGYRSRIADKLIHYTQTLNYDDLARPQSTLWLKPDLLQVIKTAGTPAPIRDIIFREFLIL